MVAKKKPAKRRSNKKKPKLPSHRPDIGSKRVAALIATNDFSDMAMRTLKDAEKVLTSATGKGLNDAMFETFRSVAECIDQAEELLRTVNGVRVSMIRAQLALGLTMEEVGNVHGLSRQRIGQLLKAYPPKP